MFAARSTNISSEHSSSGKVVKANHATLIAWLVLNVWPSHLGLPLLIATILLARNIRRHATFINLCITWMIVGFSSSLLLYSGFQTGPEPPRILCLIQASLLYAQPGMTSMSAFALVFQVFYVVRATFREKDPHHNHTLRKWLLLIAPYFALFLFSGLTAYTGAMNPSLVSRERRFFYCSVKCPTLTNAITTFSFIVLLTTITLEIWIAYLTYKHWRILRGTELTESTGMDLNLILRTTAFGLYVFLGMGLSMLSIRAPESPIPDMALATMGSAVVLVFGTQRDVLRAWTSWRGHKKSQPESSVSFSSPYADKETTSSSSLSLKHLSRERNSSSCMSSSRTWFAWFSGRKGSNGHDITGSRGRPFISHPIVREDLTFPALPSTVRLQDDQSRRSGSSSRT